MEQENLFLVIGSEGVGKSALINKLNGVTLSYTLDQENHRSFLTTQQNEVIGINNKFSSSEFSTCVIRYKNYFEIPLQLKEHEKESLKLYNYINRKCSHFLIILVIPFDKWDIKLQEMKNYLKKVLNPFKFEKQLEKVALVFTKLWEHDIQFVQKLKNEDPIFKSCSVNFFTYEGVLQGNLQNNKGYGRKNLDLGVIANILGIKYYIIECILRSNLTEEMIEVEFEYFKSVKKQFDPIIQSQFQKFLMRIIYEIRAKIYEGKKEEEEKLTQLLNTEIQDQIENYDLFLQYYDLKNFKKYFYGPEDYQEKDFKRKNTGGSAFSQPDLSEIEKKIEFLNQTSIDNRKLIMDLKNQYNEIREKVQINNKDKIEFFQSDKVIQQLDSLNNKTLEDIQNIQPFINNQSFGKKKLIESEIKSSSHKSQRTISIIDEKEYQGNCNHDALKIEVAIKNDDLETFKQTLEEIPKIHHIKIDDIYLTDFLKKENKKEFTSFAKQLIKKRFKGNIHKYAGFHQICRIRALLFAGVSVNKQNEEGQTPLFQALQKKGMETIQFLLDQGADINFQDHQKMTPLIWGVKYPYLENIKLLLEKGALIEAKTESGMNALMWAASFGYLDIVQLLVESGCDLNQKDNNERTALQIALQKKQSVVAQYLSLKTEEKIN